MLDYCSFISFEIYFFSPFRCISDACWCCSADLSYETIQEDIYDSFGYIFIVYSGSNFSPSINRLHSSQGNANICYYDHSSCHILGLFHLSCVQKVIKELLSKPLRQMFGTGSNKIWYHLIVCVHVYQSWLDLFQAQVYFKYTIMNYISHMTL